jgi:dTDP-4-amino-4,6-dideoxygalactose transaminase
LHEEENSLEQNLVVLPHTQYLNSGTINYHIFHQYSILVKKRDKLKQFLAENSIGSDIYYPVPLHKQECFKSLGYNDADFTVTNYVCEHILSLPIYPEIPSTNIATVVKTIAEFFGK